MQTIMKQKSVWKFLCISIVGEIKICTKFLKSLSSYFLFCVPDVVNCRKPGWPHAGILHYTSIIIIAQL